MKIKQLIWPVILGLILPAIGTAQPINHSKFELGVNGGIFRISLDRFNDFYGNRVGFPVGGSLGYSVSQSFQIVLRGKYFQKNHSLTNSETGMLLNRQWQQSCLELGIQQYSISFSGNMRSYFGFGLAFFFIEEKKDGNFLSTLGYGDDSTQPKGFYLCIGFDRSIFSRLTFNFEIELSSAGVSKGAGLESQSIGGIYGGIGFGWLLF